MIIIGAGIAGLLAAQYFRHRSPEVFEASPVPIQNHGAVLRFRSDAIQNLTGIRMERVTVRKAVMDDDGRLQNYCTIRDANAYSAKVTRGCLGSRSIWDLTPVERWIPPADFVERMADGVNILYGHSYISFGEHKRSERAIISTAPMHVWVNAREGLEPVDFRSLGITTISATLDNCDLQQTVYMPYSNHAAYRGSIVGNRLILEMMNHCGRDTAGVVAENFLRDIGIDNYQLVKSSIEIRRQERGKILPLPQAERRALIADITRIFGVYSLGKFATWRQVVADDLIGDLKKIEGIIDEGPYGMRGR